MGDKPGYSLVSGDGGRASGLIRQQRTAEDGGSGDGGFLDLSLGSIYNNNNNNNVSSVADSGFSPVARTLLPEPPLDASSAVPVPSVVAAAATAAYTPSAPAASHASAFALGLSAGSAVPGPGDGNGPGRVLVPASSKDLAAGASPTSSAPPPPSRKSPRHREPRSNVTGGRRRRRSDAATTDDAAAADAAPTDGDESAQPPFPWATNTAGVHPTLAELIERGIVSVEGEVRCKRCEASKTISYEIRAKFQELSSFIISNIEAMHDRAPPEWMYPALPDCDECGQKKSLRPVIAAEKWRINWMFLLLSQTLGLCTLEQLKHFCARTRQHRTGAKDRVLYSTYMELCNQLCPGGPFDMASERKNRTRPFA